MVDVGSKPDTERVAIARGEVHMLKATFDLIRDGQILSFLDHVLTELGRAHDALSTVYFGS